MVGRLRLIVLLAIFIAALWRFVDDGGPRRPPPAATPAAPGPPPAALAGDPIYEIAADKPCPRLCSGTAFAIDDRGHWLTAEHVVEGCRRIAIRTDDGRRFAVRQVVKSPVADVSLLVTDATAPSLPLDFGPLHPRQDGFHIGYPASQPGEVHSVLIGRARGRQLGHGGREEPIMAWAEVSREPPREGSLGGLSGGAVLDREGRVVGVTTAESPRRGRVLSASPASLKYLLERSRLAPRAVGRGQPVGPETYGEVGRRLRGQASVALVLCRA